MGHNAPILKKKKQQGKYMSLILKSDQLFFNFFKSEFFFLTRNFHPSNSEIRTYIFPLEIRMKESTYSFFFVHVE